MKYYTLVKDSEHLPYVISVLRRFPEIIVDECFAVRLSETDAHYVYRSMFSSPYFTNATNEIMNKIVVIILFDTTYDIEFLKTKVQGTYCTEDLRTIRGFLRAKFEDKYLSGFVHFPDISDVDDDILLYKNQEQIYYLNNVPSNL